MRTFTLLLLSACAVIGQQLSLEDRLLVRESQLQLAQTHIALAQSQANVAKAEASLTQLIMTLQEQYKCAGCTLNQDLRFSPPPKPEKPAAAVPAVKAAPDVKVPPDTQGAGSKKEQREKTK